MDNNEELNHAEQWLKDLPEFKEIRRFQDEQMLLCHKCHRKNAPNRLKCLYCGETLTISPEQEAFIKPHLRKIETWEKGFNVILKNQEEALTNEQLEEILRNCRLEKNDLRQIVESRQSLPVARAESFREAQIIRQNFFNSGIEAVIVSDEELSSETLNRRIRKVEILPEMFRLQLFNSLETVEFLWEEIALIVVGTLIERKIESIELYQKNDDNKVKESSEISNDESLLDIYSFSDKIGYRIMVKGFDFSCLGTEKGFLASENIKILTDRIREKSTKASFNDSYRKLRHALGKTWEVEQIKDSKGIKKDGLTSYSVENSITINNLQQFTKYSRLQWQLLKNK